MGWQERLAVLRDLGRWEHALLLALTLLETAQVGLFVVYSGVIVLWFGV